jgi:Protein of unknown function (DUF805)
MASLSLTVRRLHDTDRSGFWYFIAFVPFAGGIVLLVFTLLGGAPGPNRFGDPATRSAASSSSGCNSQAVRRAAAVAAERRARSCSPPDDKLRHFLVVRRTPGVNESWRDRPVIHASLVPYLQPQPGEPREPGETTSMERRCS